VSHDNAGFLDLLHSINGFTGQIGQNTFRNISNIGRTFRKIGVLHLRQHIGITVGYGLKHRLDINQIVFNPLYDIFDKCTIVDNKNMSIKNTGMFIPKYIGNLLLDMLNLLVRGNECIFKTGDFRRDFLFSNRTLHCFVGLRGEELAFKHCNARGYADPFQGNLTLCLFIRHGC